MVQFTVEADCPKSDIKNFENGRIDKLGFHVAKQILCDNEKEGLSSRASSLSHFAFHFPFQKFRFLPGSFSHEYYSMRILLMSERPI